MTGDPRDRDEATPADLADEVSAWAAKLTATPGIEPDPEEAAPADPVAATDPGDPDAVDLDPEEAAPADPVAATDPGEPDSADLDPADIPEPAATETAEPDAADIPEAATETRTAEAAPEVEANALDAAGPEPAEPEAGTAGTDADSGDGAGEPWAAAGTDAVDLDVATDAGPASAVADLDPADALEADLFAADTDSAAGHSDAETAATEGSASGTSAVAQGPDSAAADPEAQVEALDTAGPEPAEAPDSDDGAGEPWAAAATNGSGPLPAGASPVAEAADHADPEPTDAAPATDGVEHHTTGEGAEATTTGREPVPDLGAALEAVLMVVDEPIPTVQLAQVLETPRVEVEATLHRLAEEYTAAGRGFDLRQVAGGWRFYSRPECVPVVERFILDGQQARLTQAALETLAVIAYRQPVSRTRVSAIRGVNCDGVVRTLVSRGLIEEAGTEQESNATLYRTTTLFLERLGLQSVDELPDIAPYLPEVDELDSEDVAG